MDGARDVARECNGCQYTRVTHWDPTRTSYSPT